MKSADFTIFSILLILLLFWLLYCFINHSNFLIANPPYSLLKVPYFIYFISSLFKVDLHLAYKKPLNVNNNTAYIYVNKFPSNNDDNKTEYLIVRQNQHVANRHYITCMGNQASTFLFFAWKILVYPIFLLSREQVTIFLKLCTIRSQYQISQNWNLYFEVRFGF